MPQPLQMQATSSLADAATQARPGQVLTLNSTVKVDIL